MPEHFPKGHTTFRKGTPEINKHKHTLKHIHFYTNTHTCGNRVVCETSRERERKRKRKTESVLLNNIITNLGEEEQKTILLSTLIILERYLIKAMTH